MVADSRSRPSAISPLRKRWNPNKGDRIILLVNVSVPRCPSSVRVAQPCVWCLSPFVCGYVVYILGIQNVFFVTAGCGLLNQALAYITFPETLELERRRTVSSCSWESGFEATRFYAQCPTTWMAHTCFIASSWRKVSPALWGAPIYPRGGCPHGRFKSAAAQTSFRTEEDFHPHSAQHDRDA